MYGATMQEFAWTLPDVATLYVEAKLTRNAA